MADRCRFALQRLDDGQEAQVEAQHLVLGMVCDPGDLVRAQARIECVQHPTGAADAEIQLQMPVTVPGQRRDPVAKTQLQAVQRVGYLARSRSNVVIGVSVDIAFYPARDNFAVAMVPTRKLDQRGNQKRLVLHQADHGQSPEVRSISGQQALRHRVT